MQDAACPVRRAASWTHFQFRDANLRPSFIRSHRIPLCPGTLHLQTRVQVCGLSCRVPRGLGLGLGSQRRGCRGAVRWNNPQGLLQSAGRCGVGGASTGSRRGQELCQEGTLFRANGLFLPPRSFIRVVWFPCGSVQRQTDLLSETIFRNNIGRLNLIFCNLKFFSNSKFLK